MAEKTKPTEAKSAPKKEETPNSLVWTLKSESDSRFDRTGLVANLEEAEAAARSWKDAVKATFGAKAPADMVFETRKL